MFAGTYYDLPGEPLSPVQTSKGGMPWDGDSQVKGDHGNQTSDDEDESDTDSEHIPGTAIEMQDGIRKRKIIRSDNQADIQQCLHDRSDLDFNQTDLGSDSKKNNHDKLLKTENGVWKILLNIITWEQIA